MRALCVLALCACSEAQPTPSTLFISDYRANAIFRHDGTTLEVFAQIDRPAGMRVGPGDQMYTAGFGRGDVVRHDLHSGQMMGVFYWDTVLLEEPVELAFHGDELVVLGNDTNNIVVVGPDGRLARTFGYPLIRQAHDFVIDREGRVLVATEPVIQIWDLASGTQLGELGRGQLALATSIALHDDAILVADWERDAIVSLPSGDVLAYVDDPIAIDIVAGDLYALGANGLVRLDAESGELLSIVTNDDRLLYPRAFMFVD